jgi:opacity protein-like surface antigen
VDQQHVFQSIEGPDDDWVMGFGASAGISYAVTDNAALQLSLHYNSFSDQPVLNTPNNLVEDGNARFEKRNTSAFAIQIGLRYEF